MKPFEKCPVCGGGLENKRVEKLLKGGGNTVSIKVAAEVCLRCGERLYAEDVVKSFEEIRNKLRRGGFQLLQKPRAFVDICRRLAEPNDPAESPIPRRQFSGTYRSELEVVR